MRGITDSKTKIESAIEEAVQFLPKNFEPRHVHSKRCYRVLKHILYPDEYTIIEAKQSLFKSLSPIRLVATNQRIIVVKPSFGMLWMGRNVFTPTKYESIKYDNVNNITLYTGTIFSSIYVHLNTGSEAGEGNIDGLKMDDTRAIFIFLEKTVEALRKREIIPNNSMDRLRSLMIGGNKIDLGLAKDMAGYRGSKFIWLGAEPVEYASARLGIEIKHIGKIDVSGLADMNVEEAKRLEGSIFVCYNDFFATRVSEYLKKNYNVDTYVLTFGSEYQPVDDENMWLPDIRGSSLPW